MLEDKWGGFKKLIVSCLQPYRNAILLKYGADLEDIKFVTQEHFTYVVLGSLFKMIEIGENVFRVNYGPILYLTDWSGCISIHFTRKCLTKKGVEKLITFYNGNGWVGGFESHYLSSQTKRETLEWMPFIFKLLIEEMEL